MPLLAALCASLLLTVAQTPLRLAEGDFVIPDFRFTSGETISQLRIHYRTLGAPQRDAAGVVRNAVLIMHGTGGTGAQFIGRELRR